MKLSNSETLFVSQVLFYLKNSSLQFDYTCDGALDSLLKKCNSYFVSLSNNLESESDCCFDKECVNTEKLNDSSFDEEDLDIEDLDNLDEDAPHNEVNFQKLLMLSPVRVSHEGNKRTLSFEKGIPALTEFVDLTLDDGNEIVLDVTKVERTCDELRFHCASGWIIMQVQKFPKDWTALLSPGRLYKVVS